MLTRRERHRAARWRAMAGVPCRVNGARAMRDGWPPRLQCVDESKAPTLNLRKSECREWLEDYNECLHHGKEVGAAQCWCGCVGAGWALRTRARASDHVRCCALSSVLRDARAEPEAVPGGEGAPEAASSASGGSGALTTHQGAAMVRDAAGLGWTAGTDGNEWCRGPLLLLLGCTGHVATSGDGATA